MKARENWKLTQLAKTFSIKQVSVAKRGEVESKFFNILKNLTEDSSEEDLENAYIQSVEILAEWILTNNKPENVLKEILKTNEVLYLSTFSIIKGKADGLAGKMYKNMEKEFARVNFIIFQKLQNKEILDHSVVSNIYRFVLENKILESIRGKNYLIFSLVVIEDYLNGRELLSLLAGNSLYGNRKEFYLDVDRWGSRLIWPFSKEGRKVFLDLLSEESISKIDQKLNLDRLAEEINNCNPEEVIQLFPKTVRNLKLRNTLKNKFYVKSLP